MFYLNTFLIFSIIGFLYEFILNLFIHQNLRTLLIGPWMPIYGIGILIVELINKTLNKFKIKDKRKIIYCFILSVFLLTILEEIGGLLVLFFFNTSFWNYEGIPLSIGPFINVFVSIIWGTLALFLEYIIYPLITPFIKKIPKWVSITLLIIFIADNIYCFIKYL